MITLDGREVKIGDRLYSIAFGWGTVVEIADYDCQFPIDIKFDLMNSYGTITYSCNGREYNDTPRTLYWDEPAVIPKPVKKLVKKWRWVFEWFDCGHPFYSVSEPVTEEEAKELAVNTKSEIVGRIQESETEEYV